MAPRALMILGDGSDAGKSVLTAGLCRAFANRGLTVAPFKAQNMSNNAAAVTGGGEIGRAQALQARAARRESSVHFNPVLLKPQGDGASQLILQGCAMGAVGAKDWRARRATWMPAILDSFAIASKDADLVLVEGAGSPAETNLRAGDVANLGFAEAAGLPALIIGDIDRGGVIASLVGTAAVLSEADRARIRGFLINKFRGDPSLFAPAMDEIAARTFWAALGIVPWTSAARRLPSEDAVRLERDPSASTPAKRLIAVPMLSRIANFDDFDPLAAEPEIELRFIPPGTPIPREADLIILPGTKSTLADLDVLRAQGWDIDIKAHIRAGGRVFGVCGGLQMLGRSLRDPDGLDGLAGEREGLGLAGFDIVMRAPKIARPVKGQSAFFGAPVSGYEIHMGRLENMDGAPLFALENGADGWVSADGRIAGGHLHGLFSDDRFRAAFLNWIGAESRLDDFETGVDAALDEIAATLETALDLDQILSLAERPGWSP